MNRHYFSVRTGKNPNSKSLTLPFVLRLLRDIYIAYENNGFFQETFGYYCVDQGDVPGLLGTDIEAQMFRRLRKSDLWPISGKILTYSEDDLFDVIEFLYDTVSEPIEGLHHQWNNCGWHYSKFNKSMGQEKFRGEINTILVDYGDGYELSMDGEILTYCGDGLVSLISDPWPITDPDNIDSRIEAAIRKFLRARSTEDEKRDAIRDLCDVLEYIRPQVRQFIDEDEADLYILANKFGLRHHNESQKTNYPKDIWYPWIFYYYLSTLRAVLKIKENHEKTTFLEDDLPF